MELKELRTEQRIKQYVEQQELLRKQAMAQTPDQNV